MKVCAVDETWSGLKFVYRLKDRPRKQAVAGTPFLLRATDLNERNNLTSAATGGADAKGGKLRGYGFCAIDKS